MSILPAFKNNQNNFMTLTIAESLKNKSIRQNTLFVVTPRRRYYLYEGKKYSVKKFHELFPINAYHFRSDSNPDNRNKFLNENI